ncbi:hypothetical protein ES708_30597 [subsurface metagenome]
MEKLLQNMTWEEAKDTIKGTKMAIIPTGSTEQHGPHLPLGTDLLIADYFAKKVAEKIDVLVTPVVPVGFAHYHTSFEGTLSVNPEVLSSYYQGIAESNACVYGCLGLLNNSFLGAVSTIFPKYITATLSQICFITLKS